MELIETQFEDVTFWLNWYLLYHCAYRYIMIQLLNDSAAEGSFKSSAYRMIRVESVNFISTLIKYASPNVSSLNLCDFDEKSTLKCRTNYM